MLNEFKLIQHSALDVARMTLSPSKVNFSIAIRPAVCHSDTVELEPSRMNPITCR